MSMMGDPQRRFKVNFIETLLDDRLQVLANRLSEQQKENFTQEEETLGSLNVIQQVNNNVERILNGQKESLG